MILDTCALLWLSEGGGRFSSYLRERINAEPIIYVSAISGFEIGMKYQKGKLGLPARPLDWFKIIVEHHDIRVISLDLRICIRSTELPNIHQDPCDRLIIASAEFYRLPVVTADPIFAEYGIDTLI